MPKELKIEVTYLDLATTLEDALERAPTPEEVKEFFEYIEKDVGSWINDNARSFITKRTEEGRPLDEGLGRDEAEGNEVLAHLEDDKRGKRDVMLGKHTRRFRDEQAENDRFVRLVGGIEKADHMQQIWKMSYPQGNCGMLKGKSKEEVFREKAKAEGFTDIQVNRFLDL